MLVKRIIFVFLVFLLSFSTYAQKDSLNIKVKKTQITTDLYNPLSPSKAAFYSAIFPGGGQIYNKKYWKAPIVWGAIGASAYYYITNSNDYDRFRTAFRLRSQGLKDEFTDDNGNQIISTSGLENAQKVLRKNRDLSLLTGVLLYVLQIVEASVNAHLLQFETNDNLTINPSLTTDPMFQEAPRVGLTFKYSF
ncbi:hypothetical protein SAMN04489761_3912 [Tenacibaculum sp. MAR_2009_124]|uniref:DUF5683 domain-containing protein n=1 Tax=Tenacibaculum sp. MAR_2009_124 TaxID=1250059 RepID=UPI00089C309E|nr:DUF5683 domain-containing protein [Tenacibaculum sp. MAR_2009_124]SEC90121.1 hypothetical protein SAMN04489761_3912 [Tenacibaculum sp. MAR_2009_124]